MAQSLCYSTTPGVYEGVHVQMKGQEVREGGHKKKVNAGGGVLGDRGDAAYADDGSLSYSPYNFNSIRIMSDFDSKFLLVQGKGEASTLCRPYMPDFPMSEPIEFRVGEATYRLVYGPLYSSGKGFDENSKFP